MLNNGKQFNEEFAAEPCALLVVVLNRLREFGFRRREKRDVHFIFPYLASTSAIGIAFNSPRS